MRRTLGVIATLTILAGSTAACGPAVPSAQVRATPTETLAAASPSPTVDRRAELKAQAELKKSLPLAAAALVRAVPEP